MKIKNRER